jgi:hypothetical protein
MTKDRKQWSYRKIVEWVWAHLHWERCPPTGDGRARVLWKYAKENTGDFMDKYVPMLMKGEKPEEEKNTVRAVLGDTLERLEAFLNETGVREEGALGT